MKRSPVQGMTRWSVDVFSYQPRGHALSRCYLVRRGREQGNLVRATIVSFCLGGLIVDGLASAVKYFNGSL